MEWTLFVLTFLQTDCKADESDDFSAALGVIEILIRLASELDICDMELASDLMVKAIPSNFHCDESWTCKGST